MTGLTAKWVRIVEQRAKCHTILRQKLFLAVIMRFVLSNEPRQGVESNKAFSLLICAFYYIVIIVDVHHEHILALHAQLLWIFSNCSLFSPFDIPTFLRGILNIVFFFFCSDLKLEVLQRVIYSYLTLWILISFCPQVFTENMLKIRTTLLGTFNNCEYKSQKQTKTSILCNIVLINCPSNYLYENTHKKHAYDDKFL